MSETAAEPQTLARVILHPAQEKRLLAGHNWVFSNEIKEVRAEGEPKPGDLAVIVTSSGHELGLCFYHPNSLIAGRMLTRSPKDVIDAEFFRKRLADAMAYREKVCPGENAYRLCFGESDGREETSRNGCHSGRDGAARRIAAERRQRNHRASDLFMNLSERLFERSGERKVRGTLALTPALSPRRGGNGVRIFTHCPSRLQSAPACVLFLQLHDHPARSSQQHAGERFTLSWGRGPG